GAAASMSDMPMRLGPWIADIKGNVVDPEIEIAGITGVRPTHVKKLQVGNLVTLEGPRIDGTPELRMLCEIGERDPILDPAVGNCDCGVERVADSLVASPAVTGQRRALAADPDFGAYGVAASRPKGDAVIGARVIVTIRLAIEIQVETEARTPVA